MIPIAEALTRGRQLLRAGQLQQAQQVVRQILQADPHQASALELLGVIAQQLGQLDQASDYLRQALRLQPQSPTAYHHLGNLLKQQGKWVEAVGCYQHVVRLQPDSAGAHNTLGMALQEQGQLTEAVACYRQALRLQPDYAPVYNNLGVALKRQGQLSEAVASYREGLRLQPDFAAAHNNLGVALLAQGNPEAAVAHLEQALRCQPGYAAAYNNLGLARKEQGRWTEAAASFQQALRLQPNHAEAHNNLGGVFKELGQLPEAAACFEQVLRLEPRFAAAHNNLGIIRKLQGQLAAAVRCFEEALRCQPHYAEAYNNLGGIFKDQSQPAKAVACWTQALRLQPDLAEAHGNLSTQLAEEGQLAEAEAHLQEALRQRPSPQWRIQLATLLPPIYQSAGDLLAWRRRLTEHVHQLHADHVTLDLTHQAVPPPFFLVYQGFNDRDLQQALARLYTAPLDTRSAPPALSRTNAGKIRVGFLSRYFKTHTIGRLLRGLIAHLDRDCFTVIVLNIGTAADTLAQWIREHADVAVALPDSLPAARRLIAEQQLDVLFYTDIGMEPVSYSLAFSRLAPVQCVTWGHPVTTGIPTVDYILSSQALETAAGDQHYTEQLVRLPQLPIYYYRPVAPAPLKDRSHFGLPLEGTLYACPQSLFKFHPDFDEVLGGILRRDPRGRLALIRGRYGHWDQQLQQRFAVTLPDVQERIHWLPPQGYDDFLNLNAVTDVLLDPLHFGGGNTSYEGLALGVPIVTLPTEFLRARITAALYQQLGVQDCVVSSPAEYIERAVQLGTDADYRRAVRGKIESVSEVLFENRAGVRAVEQFLREAVERARSRGV